MSLVYLSIGSNVDRHHNVSSCLNALQREFGALEMSSVYESEAVGFEGSHFYNLVVAIKTQLPLVQLSTRLKSIEDQHGRDRKGPKFSPRTLDIDIVVYDDRVGTFDGIELPRPELYFNAFVLLPMAELSGTEIDPKTGQSYQSLWQDAKLSQKLWTVDFDWPNS